MTTNNTRKRETVLAQVRALMQKTVANGCTEAEADAAAKAVDRLMAAYEIDLTETTVQEQEVVQLDIKLNHHPVRWSVTKIARFCDCKCWVNSKTGFLHFVGLEVDTQIAEYMTLLFQRAIDRELVQFRMFDTEYALAGDRGSQVEKAFAVGMAERLGERLVSLKSNRDFEQKKTGFDLVLAKQPVVDEAFASLGLDLTPERGPGIQHGGAYNRGRSAADGVTISQGVGGGAAPAGRIK